MIDLDKLFSDYVTAYVRENLGKKKADEIEGEMAEIYETWQNTELSELGTTPLGFVKRLKSEGKLIAYVDELLASGTEISDIVGDAFDGSDEQGIMELYERYDDYKSVLLSVIKNLGATSRETEAFLVDIALHEQDEGLSEIAAEALFEDHEGAVDAILAEIDGLDEDRKLLAFDILYRYPGHDRTLELLLAYFKIGDNVPLFAEYIASYGDERAIPELIEFAKHNPMSKLEFREIRNAVEALGGDMPVYHYEIN